MASELEGDDSLRGDWALLFDEAPLPMALVGADDRYMEVNRRFCEMLGYRSEELIGRSYLEITHPSDLSLNRELGESLTDGAVDHFTLEKRYIRSDGSDCWVEISVSILRGVDRRPLYFLVAAMEIGARKQIEDASRRYADLLEMTTRMTLVGGWEYAPGAARPFWSSEVFRIHDIPEGEAPLFDDCLAFYPEPGRTLLRNRLACCEESGMPIDVELQLMTATGRTRWVRISAHAQREEGRTALVYGTFQDVTEATEDREALRRSQTLLQTAQKVAGLGTWSIDFSSSDDMNDPENVVSWSTETFRILRLEPGSIEPTWRNFLTFVHPGDVESFRDAVALSIRTSGRFSADFNIVLPGGEIRYVNQAGQVIRDTRSGRIQSLIGSIQDITTRKESEELLRLSQERLKVATEGGRVGTWDFDVQTETMFWNGMLFRLLGLPRQDYRPTLASIWELMSTADARRVKGIIEEAMGGEASEVSFEAMVSRPDGTDCVTRWQGIVLRMEDEKPYRVVGTCLDVTEYRRAVEAARAAVKVKADFVARISHELRTPINAILAPAEMLLQDDLSRTDRELAIMIARAAEHLLGVVNGILDFSKLEAGKMSIHPRPFDMEKLMGEYADPFVLIGRNKEIELMIDVEPAARGGWVGDDARIGQVLSNLLSNALKFSPGGMVRVRVSVAEKRESREEVEFRISDSGPGISPDEQHRIFQPFEQAGPAERKHFGTGLGLAICSELVGLMGGVIGLESEPGEGATFWFRVPMERFDQSPGDSEVNGHPVLRPVSLDSSHKPLILVVEDNMSNRRVAALLLQRLGCNAAFATTGREALEAVANEDFDLILMDCEMPGMDGYACTRILRERLRSPSRVPVVALSAHVGGDHEERCREAGIDDVLCKPAHVRDLSRVIEKWLGSRNGESAGSEAATAD